MMHGCLDPCDVLTSGPGCVFLTGPGRGAKPGVRRADDWRHARFPHGPLGGRHGWCAARHVAVPHSGDATTLSLAGVIWGSASAG